MLRGALPSYSRIVKAANDNFGGPVRTKLKESNNLIRSVSENQEKIQDLYPKFFGKLTDTITTLANETDLTMRKIQDQQKEFQDAVIAKLTGTQQATRAGGAKAKPSFKSPSKKGSSRSGSGGASLSRPAAGGSRANSGSATRTVGQATRQGGGVLSPSQGGDTNYRSGARGAEVRARAGRIARRRAVTKGLGIAAAGIGAGVGFAGAAALHKFYFGGGAKPDTAGGNNNNRQQTPSGEAPSINRQQAGAANLSGVIDLTNKTQGLFNFGSLSGREGFIIHHTAGRGTADGIINVFKQRNFPTQFIIDREGKIYQVLPSGRRGQHMKNGQGVGEGLSNANTEGVEVIAKDDSDILPVQVEAAKKLAKMLGYSDTQVYGHGEVNPHKQRTEGMTIVKAIRGDKAPLGAGQRQQAQTATINAEALSGTATPGGGFGDVGGARGTNILSVSRMVQLAKEAGFNDQEAAIMGAIGAAESSGNPNAHNPNRSTGDNSYGLWQINMIDRLGPERRRLFGIQTNEQLKDPKINAMAARKIFQQQGFKAWSVYKSGKYLQFLGTAQSAVGSPTGSPTSLANQPNVPVDGPAANAAANPAAPPGSPTGTSSGYTSPVDGARISSKFGYRIHPIRKTRRMHTGVDYAAPTGTPVKATADGTVVRAGVAGGYGNMVEVQHSDGTTSRYAHLHTFRTSVGQPVKQGQVIGLVGSTGMSTGPHLHFEIRKNGSPVDPLGMISGSAATVPAEEGARATEPIAGPGNTLAVPGPGGQVASQSATAGIPTMQMNPFVGSPLFGLAQMFGFMMGAGMPAMGGVKPIIINNTKTITRARTVDGGNLNQFPIVATSFFGAFARAF